VELNCALLNQELLKVTPYAQCDRIQISRLSFHVESWTNLRKAPIHVDIEHITAQLSEPFHFVEEGERDVIRQVTVSELNELIRNNLVAKLRTASYNLLDRIIDNLSVEIRSLSITFQPVGKFKTRCQGPWTPPAVLIQLNYLKWVSVNEFGQEDTVENVWRHNHHHERRQQQQRGTNTTDNACFLIYKKFECYYQISLVAGGTTVIPIVSSSPLGKKTTTTQHHRSAKMEIQVTMERRIRDAAFMAVQVDVSLPLLDVEIQATTVPLLVHFAAALSYCMAKDRSFIDPLKTTAGSMTSDSSSSAGQKLIPQQKPERTSSSSSLLDVTEDTEPALAAAEVALAESFSEGSGEDPDADDTVGDDDGCENETVDDPAKTSMPLDNRPVLVMPNGMIFREKVAISVSILHMDIRCLYSLDDNGSMIISANGLVTEGIWPKVTKVRQHSTESLFSSNYTC
jgi:hypothetical protein